MKLFLSYTRSKDDFHAVSEFRAHLASEIKGREPTSIVFQDTSIGTGQAWPDVLRDQLAAADVLVVLVSPAYLLSEWCRKEFEQFVHKEKTAGRRPRILPVLWIETPNLVSPNDDIAKQLSEIQQDDWHLLRHKGWDSEEIRQRIDALASKAIGLAARME
jgi:hypothetical protein